MFSRMAVLAAAVFGLSMSAGAQSNAQTPDAPARIVCKAKSADGKSFTGAPGVSNAQAKKSAIRACEDATKQKCDYESCLLERSKG